jgi:hypothetical protein
MTFFYFRFFGSFLFRFAYFALLISLRSFSFRLWIPVFRFETKQAKKQNFSLRSEKFFASFSLRFASNRKRTAHPNPNAVFFQPSIFQLSIFQWFLYFNSKLFQHSFISIFYIRGGSLLCNTTVCCSNAQPLRLLCSAFPIVSLVYII